MNIAVELADQLERLVGPEGVERYNGHLRVTPSNHEATAAVLRTASDQGWRVAIAGQGSWSSPNPSADIVISTRRLRAVRYVNSGDLVATVDAGLGWHEMQEVMSEHDAWVALDPPGDSRTVGSVVATATSGPLHAGFGAVRDQLLGLTYVTGDGRVVSPGGRVVKNVAGFDLTKLLCGSWGAFGVITSVTFRLRAMSQSDITVAAHGSRDELFATAMRFAESGQTPQGLEIHGRHRTDEWTLTMRFLDTAEAVQALTDAFMRVAPSAQELSSGDADRFWQEQRDHCSGEVTVRVGAQPTQFGEASTLLIDELGEGDTSANPLAGWLRWTGSADAEALRRLRATAAESAMPLTIERAPSEILAAVGRFGALPDGVGPLVSALRRALDPQRVFATSVGVE